MDQKQRRPRAPAVRRVGVGKIRARASSMCSTLFSYLSETQKRSLGQLTQISTYEPDHYMILDPFTRRNLELVETVRERSKKGSLLWLLDRTETSMGARMMRRWVDKPFCKKERSMNGWKR